MLIDLNADLGEGSGHDAEIMPWITSANICCGVHAGGAETTSAALELARRHGVKVGAHPGYPEHFGRRERPDATEQTIRQIMLHQLGAVRALAALVGVELAYVKPHGGLYHQVCRDAVLADAFLDAVAVGMPELGRRVVGLPNSALQRAAKARNIPFAAEGFADRRYQPDGALVPRDHPDALIHDPQEAVEQVERLIRVVGVRTICVHGDTPGAVEFVRVIRGHLQDRGHELRAFA